MSFFTNTTTSDGAAVFELNHRVLRSDCQQTVLNLVSRDELRKCMPSSFHVLTVKGPTE